MKYLTDISNYKNNTDWIYIVTSVLFLEIVFIIVYSQMSSNLTEWYKKFGLNAIISDCAVILLGIALTRYTYRYFIYPKYGFSPFLFILTALSIQIAHDFIYYFAVVLPIPKGFNSIIDFMKNYGKTGGIYTVLGDSSMIIAMSLFAMFLASFEPHNSVYLLLFAIYMIPYVI